MPKFKHLLIICLVIVALRLGVANAEWTPPGANPPTGNTFEPLDTSTNPQYIGSGSGSKDINVGSINFTNDNEPADAWLCLNGNCIQSWEEIVAGSEFWGGNDLNVWNLNSGSVGIGTNSGILEKFHVKDGEGGTARIRIDDPNQNPELQLHYGPGANEHWALYVSNPNNSPAGDGSLRIWTPSGDKLAILPSGDLGIGTTNPGAKLEVAGQIKITGGVPGAGKVLTSDATGLASWQAVSGGLPAGTSGQTLRHNGIGWIANSLIYNDGSKAGVNSTNPTAEFQVVAPKDTEGIRIVAASNWSPFNIVNTASTDDIFRVDQSGILQAGQVPFARLISSPTNCTANSYVTGYNSLTGSWVCTGVSSSINGSGTANYVAKWSATSTLSNSAIYDNGSVGIGTTNPGGRLEVAGNSDSSQLVIRANATQSDTNPLIKLVKSDGTVLSSFSSDDPTNTFVGLNAGLANASTNNTFFGSNAGRSNLSADSNVAIGAEALYSNITGSLNTAVGSLAMRSTNSSSNTAVGYWAMYSNVTGSSNTAYGVGALHNNVNGNANLAVGIGALYSNTASNNHAFGFYALNQNTTGSRNTALGSSALEFNTTGNYNVAVGDHAGDNITSGSRNIIIGYDIDAPSATASNQLSIGNLIYGTGLDGSGVGLSSGNVGIRVASPGYPLDIIDNDSTGIININNTDVYTWTGLRLARGGNERWFLGMDNTPGTDKLLIRRNGSVNDIVINSLGEVGINQDSPSERLAVGDNILADAFIYSSDRRKKENIKTIEQPLDKLLLLHGVSFTWKESGRASLGFVAQEVEKVFPELVSVDGDGFKAVQYGNLTALLVEAVKEQQELIDRLEERIEALEQQFKR